MSNFLDKFKLNTRWATIPDATSGYRLLCNHESCSLSCANLRDGKLSVTSVHGDYRHSYVLTKKDMAFLTTVFLNSLSKEDLETFTKIFNKTSPDFVLAVEEIE